MANTDKWKRILSDVVGENEVDGYDDDDEEPGEVIESAPPLQVGEEREFKATGIKKKLIHHGTGWETPNFGDEVTVNYVGYLPDGTMFMSNKDRDESFCHKVGQGQMVAGFDHAIVTMKKGEVALFTLPPGMGYGAAGADGVPPNSITQFKIELLSWISIVDVCKDGGILKRILLKGEQAGHPGDLDEVLVKYTAMLDDGSVVAKTPEEGIEFYMNKGHFCVALAKAVKTMQRSEKANIIVQPKYASRVGDNATDDGVSPIFPASMVNINLELVSFKPVIGITSDYKVLKKLLKEGEGSVTADEGTAVTISYTAMLEDGTVFEKKEGESALEFTTDEEQVITGLDRAAATMKKGEHAIVTVSHEYGYGSNEVKLDLATIPPFSTLIYEVRMMNFKKEKEPWALTNHERIEAAGKMKAEGNLLFKVGKYQRAAKKYDKAVDYVSEDEPFGTDDQNLVKSLRISCWLNSAACSLKLNDFREAIKQCAKVLDVEFYNVKALYRRAQAYMGTADLHLAELDIKKALEADPHNREILFIQKDLKQLQAECNKRDAKLYANMFSQMAKDCSVATKRLKLDDMVENQKTEVAKAVKMEVVTVDPTPNETEMAVDSS